MTLRAREVSSAQTFLPSLTGRHASRLGNPALPPSKRGFLWCGVNRFSGCLCVLLLVLLSSCYVPRPDVNSSDSYERYLGAIELYRNPSADNMKKLIDLWHDPDMLVREGALKSMAKLAYPAFKDYAMKSMEDSSWLVRSQAVHTLVAIDSQFAQQFLIDRLAQEKDQRVKIEIIKIIEPNESGLKVLVEAIGDEGQGVSYASYKRLTSLSGENLPREKTAWLEWLKKKQNQN